MKRAIGVVVGVVVAVGAVWTAGAWYTGKRLETVMRQRVDDANARLRDLFPGGRAVLSLESLDRHLFSTDMLLRVRIRTGNPHGQPAAREDVVDIVSHVGHGPFPLERIEHGRLAPVMAAGAFGLQENDTVRPWFALTQGVAPVSGHVAISYGQAVTGTVRVEPVKMAHDGVAVDFSGLALDFSQDADKHTRVDGAFDHLAFSTVHGDEAMQAELNEATLSSDTRPGPADLQIGNTTLSIKRLTVAPAGHTPIALTGYSQRTDASEDKGALSLHGAYGVSMLNVAGKDIGSLQMSLGAKHLAPDAVKSLASLYGRVWSRMMQETPGMDAGQGPRPPALTPQEEAQALAARDALLKGNPTFYIDPILLKAPRGEARFTLNVDLGDPGPPDQPIDQRVATAVRKLDARASIAQPLLAALLSDSMQRDGMSAPQADAQGLAMVGLMGKVASDAGYATVQGSEIVSTLQYADRMVDLNGTKMTLDQFAGKLMQGVLGAVAQPGDDQDEPDQGEPDEGQPDEGQPDADQPGGSPKEAPRQPPGSAAR
jgi:uncharacterized protein YdgA (DUF945 family)